MFGIGTLQLLEDVLKEWSQFGITSTRYKGMEQRWYFQLRGEFLGAFVGLNIEEKRRAYSP